MKPAGKDDDEKDKAKMESRKAGTRIAEVEKRGIVARLKARGGAGAGPRASWPSLEGAAWLSTRAEAAPQADEAEWKKRDVHASHVTRGVAPGEHVIWGYTPEGKPAEMWFRIGTILDIQGDKLKDDKKDKNSNLKINLTLRALDPPLKYPFNSSDLKERFTVRGEEDDPDVALEELKKRTACRAASRL